MTDQPSSQNERPLESKYSSLVERVLHDWTRCEKCDRLARGGGCGNVGCPLLHWHPTREQVAEAERNA
jgi:hypothetical protein